MDDISVYKIVLIGNSGTGKTNITNRFVKKQYIQSSPTSVGAEFHTMILPINGKNIKITIWDTAGQERYKSLSNIYYKGARGVIIVYDVSDPQSYVDIQGWMRLVNQSVDLNKITVFVAGNKCDLKAIVPFDRVEKEYKKAFDLDCWQVSAKTGHNVIEMFNSMFQHIHKQGTEVKNSIFLGQSDLVAYSQVERQSLIHHKEKIRGSREMTPIQQTIMEQRDEASRTRNGGESVAPSKSKMMTLSMKEEKERIQESNKKKKCCW